MRAAFALLSHKDLIKIIATRPESKKKVRFIMLTPAYSRGYRCKVFICYEKKNLFPLSIL